MERGLEWMKWDRIGYEGTGMRWHGACMGKKEPKAIRAWKPLPHLSALASWQSVAISGNQWQSMSINDNQRQSVDRA
jgi:hypothetical protein